MVCVYLAVSVIILILFFTERRIVGLTTADSGGVGRDMCLLFTR